MGDIKHRITELEQRNEELEGHVRKCSEELRHTQAQLVQSEKMACIGQLAAGIAHEINNPTGFVSSDLKTLEEYIKDMKSLLAGYDAMPL